MPDGGVYNFRRDNQGSCIEAQKSEVNARSALRLCSYVHIWCGLPCAVAILEISGVG